MKTQDFQSEIIDQIETGESKLQQARKLLGKVAEKMTDEELKDQIVRIDDLVESWLDEYERKIFDGKTLNELLDKGR